MSDDWSHHHSDAHAANEAMLRQDHDFGAIGIILEPKIRLVDEWAEDFDIETVSDRAMSALSPWVEHFTRLGLIRADGLRLHEYDTDSAPMDCTFFLVHAAADVGDTLEILATIKDVGLEIPSLPEATLSVVAHRFPANATMLFEAAKRQGLSVGRGGGNETPELNPMSGETRDEWLRRVAFSGEQLASAAERWEVSGRNPIMFRAFGDQTERVTRDETTQFVVDGILARGEVTFVVGSSKLGKSSMVHSWLAALGCIENDRHREVLGVPIEGNFACVLISGEERDATIEYRARKHASLWGRSRYAYFTDMSKGLDFYLDLLWGMEKLDVVVFDSVRSFFRGDEKNAIAVEEFLQPFSELARAKNCAVIFLHHTTKGAEPRSMSELKVRARGSGGFIDHARMTIGMVKRAKGMRSVGPVAYNLTAEEAWLPMGESIDCWPDPDTLTLQPVEGAGKINVAALAPAESRVLAAVVRCNQAGTIVRKSGKYGLYEFRLPDLAGLSRNAILAAIAELVASGELSDGEAGLIARQSSPGTGDG